ncbi:hypothetical protein [Streptomyces sp. NPDC001492]
MATAIEPRPLADLEMDSVLAVEALWGRRAHGMKPQTIPEYLDAVDRVHAQYAMRREWLRRHGQVVA